MLLFLGRKERTMTRLIDADALSKKVSSTTLFIKDAEVFQRMINDATTIEPSGDLTIRPCSWVHRRPKRARRLWRPWSARAGT